MNTRLLAGIISLILLLTSTATAINIEQTQPAMLSLGNHDPIVIDENDDFPKILEHIKWKIDEDKQLRKFETL